MAESVVKCDGCGQPGRRRANHPCPDHWFYLESVDRTFDEQLGTYVVWACSETCRDALWKRGPGPASIDDEGTMQRRRELESGALWAECHEPPASDGAPGCGWTGEMGQLDDRDGTKHCPNCGSTAIVEDIDPNAKERADA